MSFLSYLVLVAGSDNIVDFEHTKMKAIVSHEAYFSKICRAFSANNSMFAAMRGDMSIFYKKFQFFIVLRLSKYRNYFKYLICTLRYVDLFYSCNYCLWIYIFHCIGMSLLQKALNGLLKSFIHILAMGFKVIIPAFNWNFSKHIYQKTVLR